MLTYTNPNEKEIGIGFSIGSDFLKQNAFIYNLKYNFRIHYCLKRKLKKNSESNEVGFSVSNSQ